MPKIGKESIQVSGDWIQIDLMYSRKNGFSAKGIPAKVLSLVTISTKKSENEFILHLRGKLKEYHELTKKEEKVILVDLAFAMSHIYGKESGSVRSGKRGIWSNSESIKTHEYGFAFDWMICKKINRESTEYFQILSNQDGELFYRKIHPTTISKKIEIPYTKDREHFFLNMAKSVDLMAEKICKFLKDDNLPFLIDSKQKLLS